MFKEFWKWHEKKKLINDAKGEALFHEREVWWCALGINVGFEQDGDENHFERPVVILKKFNLDACLVIPLATKLKEGKYYFSLGTIAGKESVAIISQVRFVDRKRLTNKICMLDEVIFKMLLKAIMKANFSGTF